MRALKENSMTNGMADNHLPDECFMEQKMDLNVELIKNPDATFYARVKGNSMIDAGVEDGDVIIIDRSLEPATGKIALCYVDGEFTVKHLKLEDDVCWLVPANDEFAPIKVTEENEFIIWGVVSYVIKRV